MHEKTMNDSAVKSVIDTKFVYLVVDTHASRENRKLAHKFEVEGVPAYVILDENDHVKKHGDGYKDKEEFIKWLMM